MAYERLPNTDYCLQVQHLFANWDSSAAQPISYFEKPDGLLGEIAGLIYGNSPRPIHGISLASAIALCAGIAGRAYNTTSNTGLNQDIQVVGKSGIGKDVTASGPDFIVSQVAAKTTFKNIYDFMGAGDFSSYAGGYQALCGPSQSVTCIIGENGKKFAELKLGKNAHLMTANRFQLQVFTKSGAGQVLRPISYAEKERKLPALSRPALTILADSTPLIYGDLSDELFVDGTIPRKLWFDIPDDRPDRNPSPIAEIPDATAQAIANVAAFCLANQTNMLPPMIVGFNPDDHGELIQNTFNDWCDQKIRSSQNESERALHSRSHIKAIRLASLQAVWANYLFPQITEKWMLWAIDIVVKQTLWLTLKSNDGDIGEVAGNETKQLSELTRIVREYLTGSFDDAAKYLKGKENVLRNMHDMQVFTQSYIQRWLFGLSAFKNDRQGPTRAIDRAIASLLQADDIREMPNAQTQEKFGIKPRSFVVTNPYRFAKPP